MQQFHHDSDWDSLEKIKRGDPSSFEQIYTRYAPMMFGCILDICKEQQLASLIFKHVFLNLGDAPVSKAGYVPFSFWLWQHTGKETLKYMNENITSTEVPLKKAIIDYLCFNEVNRDEAAALFNLSQKEIILLVKKDLQNN